MFKLFDPVKEYVFYLDFSYKCSKLQYNSLAFVASLKRATDEGLLPESVQKRATDEGLLPEIVQYTISL